MRSAELAYYSQDTDELFGTTLGSSAILYMSYPNRPSQTDAPTKATTPMDTTESRSPSAEGLEGKLPQRHPCQIALRIWYLNSEGPENKLPN
jgi:hypothetical protein